MRPVPYTALDRSHPKYPIAFQARFALRYGNRRQVEGGVPNLSSQRVQPFWPFLLVTTSVGQEGIDLHWCCHPVVHWNTPAKPRSTSTKREGRVQRYGGHAIRKKISVRHGVAMSATPDDDSSTAGHTAATDLRHQFGELSPHWAYPGASEPGDRPVVRGRVGHQVPERHVDVAAVGARSPASR